MAEITAAMVKELRESTNAGMMDCKKALMETNGDFDKAVTWLREKGLSIAAKKGGRGTSDGLIGLKSDTHKGVLVEINSETDFVAKNDKFQEFVKECAANTFNSSITDVEALKNSKLKSGKTVEEEKTELVAVIGENMNVRRVALLEQKEGIICTYLHNAIADGLGKIGVMISLKSSASADKLMEIGKKLAMHVAASRPTALTIADVSQADVENEKAIFAKQAENSGKPKEIIAKMVEGRVKKYYDEVVFLEQAFVMDNKLKVSDFVAEEAKKLGTTVSVEAFVRFELGEGIVKEQTDFAAEVASMVK